MISERDFASSFRDFWRELLPLLTPSCVHVLNQGHEVVLLDEAGEQLPVVAVRDESRDSAVVSEFAYHLACAATSHSMTILDSAQDAAMLNSAQTKAIELVNTYEGKKRFSDTTLNPAEIDEGIELAQRYEAFARNESQSGQVKFSISVPGAGFLQACRADMALRDYLVEVKTVKRSLAGKDIRQLVVYLALSAASSGAIWTHAGFLNPRRSTYHKFRTTELIEIMSGGKSVVDVFGEFSDFVCSSDVQLDTVF